MTLVKHDADSLLPILQIKPAAGQAGQASCPRTQARPEFRMLLEIDDVYTLVAQVDERYTFCTYARANDQVTSFDSAADFANQPK